MPMHRGNCYLCKRYKWLLVLAIFILGFCLRLYRVGHNLFWFDEVGVANAAEQPSLLGALTLSQRYIMSMPLDYVIAWGVAHISGSEFMLRLPSVIWGSLTLIAAYFLYREITNDRTAILGIFLLALTPIHIRYSQELKFYAALTFFYVLSNYFALISVKRKEPHLWILFVAITIIGILFHVYTTLVLVNLTSWVVLITYKAPLDRKLWNSFVVSTAIILLFAVFSIVLFGKSPGYPSNLFGFETPWQVFGGGFGWIPLFPCGKLALLFGMLCMTFTLIGSVITLLKGSAPFYFAIVPAVLFQICLIVSADIVKHYFALSRQFLVLVPLMILLTAIGIEQTVRYLTKSAPKLYHAGLLFGVLILFVSALAALSPYYQTKRTDALAVVNQLSAHWHDGDIICVDPGYESFTYHYYLQRWGVKQNDSQLIKISESLLPFEGDRCQQGITDVSFLITSSVHENQKTSIKSKGFRSIYISPSNVVQPQIIWYRPK